MSKEKRTKQYHERKATRFFPKAMAWGMVLLWMSIIFWFSHQPAAESAAFSLNVMRLGGRVLSHWQLAGFVGFTIVFNIFLIWLTRRSTPGWAKVIFLLLFLLCCFGVVYVLYYIVRPRYNTLGIHHMNRLVLHNFLRKYAHFIIYLFLGVIVKNALSVSGITGLKSFAIALLICALYAVTDEIHQAFVPGRRPLVMDVVIDSAGSFVGITLYSIIDWIAGHRTIWQAFWNTQKAE